MQCFALLVNSVFSSLQLFENICQLNYLISFRFLFSPQREANYSKPVLRCARPFPHFFAQKFVPAKSTQAVGVKWPLC
jgi:hypothetical protein